MSQNEKTKYPPLVRSEIKLTIGMLVSNHVEYIRNCMEALKPLLEAVPSELVVIDTKGADGDGSIAIVREYTDRIYPFTWCNDFSAARNFCLSHARGEWFLYQDDDEWFDDVQEFIDFFTSGECEEYHSGFYYTKDYDAFGGSSMGIAGRMIRRTENTHFVGRVHETFNEVYAPNKLFSCFTHHMGYKFATEESRKKHQERNLSILREEWKECGYTPRICAQMVQEYLYVEETAEEGYRFAKECAEQLVKQGQIGESCSQWILTSLVRHFARLGDYEKMCIETDRVRAEYPLSQMAELVVAAVVVREATKHNDFSRILKFSEEYIKNWNWLQAHPEETLLQTQMDFPRYYSDIYYEEIVRVKTEAQKIEIAQLLTSMKEAAPVIREVLQKEPIGQAVELLTTLQELVIVYANRMEAAFGENAERDERLGQCCELIWQTANAQTRELAVQLFEEALRVGRI